MRSPSAPAILSLLFGTTSFLFGLSALLNPTQALTPFDLPVSALPSVQASSCAAIAMGIFYSLAAYQENLAFFRCSVITRMVTTIVLWKAGGAWRGVAIWEGVGAASTAVALLLDKRR
jgi:hypothetical protein